MNVRQILDDIQFNDLKLPEENRFRIPTMNQFGYMFIKFDPIIDKWLESIIKNPDQILFKVGGAYGNVAKVALEKGIKKYYLNDCEEKHGSSG